MAARGKFSHKLIRTQKINIPVGEVVFRYSFYYRDLLPEERKPILYPEAISQKQYHNLTIYHIHGTSCALE